NHERHEKKGKALSHAKPRGREGNGARLCESQQRSIFRISGSDFGLLSGGTPDVASYKAKKKRLTESRIAVLSGRTEITEDEGTFSSAAEVHPALG
ncbi:MAG TPA: hypothetical protein PKH32_10330, partial [Verrucomicrobiota bacterium]|nr:hypothetical protein [Verrucomicrobiota bacterium]